MPLIDLIQTELNDQTFNSPSLSDPIRFKADLESGKGVVVDINSAKESAYEVVQVDSSARLRTTYFPKELTISISALGFDLFDLSGSKFLSFINEFWIDNQDVINGILEYLQAGGDNGRSYDEVSLFLVIRDRFSPTVTLKEGHETIDRIMDMLVRNGAVGKAMHLGKETIQYIPGTKKALEEGRFTWN
jgi:hypothetical protein